MSASKSHCQLAVEYDDDATSDSLSVIKKYSFHQTTAAVSVLKDFIADRQQSSINSFFKLLFCESHFEKILFLFDCAKIYIRL